MTTIVLSPPKGTTDAEYLAWFNQASSVDESVSMGFVDFAHKIFTEDMYAYVGNPIDKTCCEIGFGGGRLVIPATFFFKHVHGIDVHDDFKRTRMHIERFGRKNFALHTQSEVLSGSIPDKSVDFVFSYIVFQHFLKWQTAEDYISLIGKILTNSGSGVLYFGQNASSDDVVTTDITDLRTYPITLFVKPEYARQRMEAHGLDVLSVSFPTKRPWTAQKSHQFCLKFKRNVLTCQQTTGSSS